MTDGTGRVIDYLRVSVTDRCNLRCVYCMPAQGVEPEPYENLLTLEEITRVCAAAARLLPLHRGAARRPCVLRP